jgi:ribosomal protein S13
MRSFNNTLPQLLAEFKGLKNNSIFLFLKRFELGYYKYKLNKNLLNFQLDQRKIINMYLSQMTSVNHEIGTMIKYNLIRLYLIKTFRGKAMALGKPSKGQRT